MSAFANPCLIPELIMNPVPQPGEPPKTKVMVHGLPGSKFTRQHAPTDATFEHIKDGIRNLALINSPLSSFGSRCWKQRFNQRPLRRRQIARIGKLIHPTTILHAFSDRFLAKCRDQGTAEVRPDHVAVLASVTFLDSVISALLFGGLC
jgi:hypothetical protein